MAGKLKRLYQVLNGLQDVDDIADTVKHSKRFENVVHDVGIGGAYSDDSLTAIAEALVGGNEYGVGSPDSFDEAVDMFNMLNDTTYNNMANRADYYVQDALKNIDIPKTYSKDLSNFKLKQTYDMLQPKNPYTNVGMMDRSPAHLLLDIDDVNSGYRLPGGFDKYDDYNQYLHMRELPKEGNLLIGTPYTREDYHGPSFVNIPKKLQRKSRYDYYGIPGEDY